MEEILKQKGYKGPIELETLLDWLDSKGIYVEFSIVWDDSGIEKVGIQAHVWFEPYDEPQNSLMMFSYVDTIEFVICYYKDFL